MKGQILKRLGSSGWALLRHRRPHLTKIDIFLVILPAILWPLLVQSRPWVVETRCVNRPACPVESLSSIDRFSVGQHDGHFEHASYLLQNNAGVVAVMTTVGWNLLLGWTGAKWVPVLTSLGTDLVILMESTLWNGVATESARLLVQRPRPFVYENPEELGHDPAHYTSFYSGHTSFTAAATTATVATLAGRSASGWILFFSAAAAVLWTAATGLCRILAGRHFFTDVLCGAIAGTAVALFVAFMHRRAPKESKGK